MDRGLGRGRLRPPSLLTLEIPKPANIPHLDWLGGRGRSRKRRRPAAANEPPEPKAKRRRKNKKRSESRRRGSWSRRREPSPPAPPPQTSESWEEAEDVHPEVPQPSGQAPKPLVPYTPSPTPSPRQSREQSPAPPDAAEEQPDQGPRHQLPGFEPSQHVDLEKVKTKNFKNLVKEDYWSVALKDLGGDPSTVMQKVLACLQYVLETMLAGEDPETTAQVFVSHKKMFNEHRASAQTMVKDLDLERMMQKLEEVVNSIKPDGEDEDAEELGDTFWDQCTFVVVTRKKKTRAGTLGKSLHTRNCASVADYALKSSSLRDLSLKCYRLDKILKDSCLLNCIALGVYKTRKPDAKAVDIKNFLRDPEMKKAVKELADMAGVPVQGPHDMAVLGLIQQKLGDSIQITVYDAPSPSQLSFGPNQAQHHINLFRQEGEEGQPAHIRLITSMQGFFGAHGFCETCKKTTSRKKHSCKQAQCKMCMNAGCASLATDAKIRKLCQDCNKTYKTEACFLAHKSNGSICREKRCLTCWEMCRKDDFEEHECGRPFCGSICGKRHSPFDYCYVPTGNSEADESKEHLWDAEEPGECQEYRPAKLGEAGPSHQSQAEEEETSRMSRRRVYGDAETSCDKESGELTVSLIVLKMVVPGGQPRRFVYTGPRAGHQLVEDFIAKQSPFKGSTVVFHNAAGFDSFIIWRATVEMGIKVDVIRKSGKILKLEFKSSGVIIIDSLLFLPGTPLSKFPAIFGLDCGDKGHYCFKLTGTKMVDDDGYYLGEDGSRFPDFKDFLPDGVRPKAYKELRVWWEAESAKYKENPEKRYCLRWEELKYCEQDVDILMGGFEVFRQQWKEAHSGMDVFDSMTLPQFINRLYRKHFMKPDTIVPLPPHGFLKKNNRGSVAAFCWLQLERRRLRAAGTPLGQLRDGRRGGEVRISGVHVDGTGVDSTGHRHVFQFHGCWWHGCPQCAREKGKPLSERQEAFYITTLEESARLRALSTDPESPYGLFEYHEIWEHDFQALVKDGEPKTYWRKFRKSWPSDPLRIRDGFHGGRTNAVCHKVKVPKGWRLLYVDFTSLYPSINYGANGELYPVGAPKVFVGPDIEEEPDVPKLEEAFGFWKVKVHPPRQLYLPVLPMAANGKLVFPLCRTCAEEERQGLCPHSREERALSGTYFTEELKKAVEMGYELDTPQEIYEWPKEQRTGQLFKKFIRELYARKVLSSSKPASDAAMEQVLADVRASVGLSLHPDDFKEDPCQRAQAKFALNNIWGFHGKTSLPEQTAMVKTAAELEELECRPDIDITSMRVVHGDELLMVSFQDKEEKVWRTGSMAIAAMTTGWARLRLYELLQQYEQHVIYFDTDSAFLLLPPGVEGPRTSDKLGDVKDEIKETYGAGKSIGAFVSLGPKCYAYLVVDEEGRPFKLEFKLKGVSLTKEAMKAVSMELMEQLADDKTKEARIHQWNIRRDLIKAGLYSHSFTKRLAFSSTKRFFIPEGPGGFKKTLPYGYTCDPKDKTETDIYMSHFTVPE